MHRHTSIHIYTPTYMYVCIYLCAYELCVCVLLLNTVINALPLNISVYTHTCIYCTFKNMLIFSDFR